MHVTETRAEMLACVAALRERLAGTTDPDRRAALVSVARRQVERLRKAFKRRIDARAVSQYGFSVNAREGIERRLSEVTAEALAAVDEAGSAGAEPGAAADRGRITVVRSSQVLGGPGC